MGKVKQMYTETCIEAYDCGYYAAYRGYGGNIVPHRFSMLKDYEDAYKDGYREGKRAKWLN
tara:strand:+ start:324 stop:506 length:183 start_codon:yes stop_codon:yes gene_type:complete